MVFSQIHVISIVIQYCVKRDIPPCMTKPNGNLMETENNISGILTQVIKMFFSWIIVQKQYFIEKHAKPQPKTHFRAVSKHVKRSLGPFLS